MNSAQIRKDFYIWFIYVLAIFSHFQMSADASYVESMPTILYKLLHPKFKNWSLKL